MIFEGGRKIERRMSKKYMDVSPERVRVSTEKSPRHHHFNHHCNNNRSSNHSSHHHHHQQQQQQYSKNKVSVVYYLCKNQQLEHPHFMEVTLSSPDDGLYLRDVTEKLNALRGRGMASMYSWSCKRIYKNGFVWHDLCEDDLIVPARENEYVLKGSELFGESSSGKVSNNSTVLTEFKIRKSEDLSTQTEKEAKSGRPFQTQNTDRIKCDTAEDLSTKDVRSEILTEHVSPPTASTSGNDSSSSGGAKTLESLIKADLRKQKNIKVLEHETKHGMPSDAKVTACSNIILQLISCGSLSGKDRNFGLIDKSRYLKIPTLLISGENQNPRMKSEDKERLSRISDSKCIPKALKDPLNKQPKCESTRLQFTEDRRISSDRSSMEAARG